MKSFSDFSMVSHIKNLFDICRSITGNGARKTLNYFEKFHPELERIKFASFTKVFDWEIPLEWNIKDSYIEHIETGQQFAKFSDSNLHIVSYSEPINTIMDLEELKKHIHTLEDQPKWIPYVTSYYRKQCGFCLSEEAKQKLPKGNYKVVVDSKLEKGFLELSHCILEGKLKKEIFFSTYICHPSMANNELSGPVVTSQLLDYIKNKYPNPNFSYRFVFLPETIGSISYLSRYEDELLSNVISGFNVTCVGDDRSYSHVKSPYGNTLADKALEAGLSGLKNRKSYSFLERGSDERQYCSPGINLPLCTFCRSKFGEYPEYHTSADNLDVVNEKGLLGSFQVLKNIVDAFEICLFPKVLVKGEPQLGKRNLYPNLSKKQNSRRDSQSRMDIIAFCNGKNSIFEICNLTKLPLSAVIDELEILIKAGLIVENFNNQSTNGLI